MHKVTKLLLEFSTLNKVQRYFKFFTQKKNLKRRLLSHNHFSWFRTKTLLYTVCF